MPAGSGALKVVVSLESGLTSRCARVVARAETERESTAVLLTSKTSVTIGISQEAEPLDVEVQAIGYSDEGCTTRTTPAERSEARRARFASPAAVVALTLRREPLAQTDGGIDADGDGFTTDVDCNDSNAAINPSATESCTNGLDDDCDSAVDCADPNCATQPCGERGSCNGGVCVAPTETGLCSDGIDNDNDLSIDCADPDCPQGTACSDFNACTQTDTCGASGAGCVGGAAVVCDLPPLGCFAPAGTCQPDAGGACSYALTTGPCMDNLFCTVNEQCLEDGGCQGTPKLCDPPPSACIAAGVCSESALGACVYAPLPSGACNDNDDCTVSDSCDGDGGCAGSRVTCTPPNECLTTASTCMGNGACIFNPRAGACDGGTCTAGACVTAPIFSYLPSNFTEAQLPGSGGAVTVNCSVAIDTRTADGGVSWTTCGTGPAQPPHSIIAAGLTSAVLFFMDTLTVNVGQEISANGPRPVVFAVRGAALINGRVDVAGVGARGAGGNVDCTVGGGADGGVGGTVQTAGGGGGAGFLTNGAAGSGGDNGGAGGARGNSNGNATLIPLRGGCRGGTGGRSNAMYGLGGHGGGAVQISAGTTITVNATGTIDASGEGGFGGLVDQRIAGGGGGSGGAILLEGTTITVNALGAVVANGGAGGEGSGYGGFPYSGVDGQDGQRSQARAVCPSIGACGGNGGSGGAVAGNPTAAGAPDCSTSMSGGGGGGSAGRVRLNAVSGCTLNGSAVISPTPTGTGSNCP